MRLALLVEEEEPEGAETLTCACVETFRFHANLLEPESLTDEVQRRFEAAIGEHDVRDLRVARDDERRTIVSFVMEAEGVHAALTVGSEITLAALADFHEVRWIASGASWWPDAAL